MNRDPIGNRILEQRSHAQAVAAIEQITVRHLEADHLDRLQPDRVHQLLEAVFEGGDQGGEPPEGLLRPDLKHLPEVINRMAAFNLRLAEYAIENPDIGRIWLYDVLSRENPGDDVFYKRFVQALQTLADSDASLDDLDIEVLAVLMLTGYFLWPVWVRAHARGKKARKRMAERFAAEVLRLSMHGVLRADSHAPLKAYLKRNLTTA